MSKLYRFAALVTPTNVRALWMVAVVLSAVAAATLGTTPVLAEDDPGGP